MAKGRRTVSWFVGVAWLFTVLTVGYHVETILRYAARPIPVWFEAASWIWLVSGAVFGIAQWSLLKERFPVRTWGLIWASASLFFIVSRAILYWRAGLFTWLACAFSVEQLVFYLRFNLDSPANIQEPVHPEESLP